MKLLAVKLEGVLKPEKVAPHLLTLAPRLLFTNLLDFAFKPKKIRVIKKIRGQRREEGVSRYS
jgi:hypothetical protein